MAAIGEEHRTRVPIPLTRLDRADPKLFETLMAAVGDLAAAGAFTAGQELEAFESEFAAYCGAEHAVGVSSGTEALALVLRGLGIREGDEVIAPTNSFIATAEAITLAGATPCLIDADPITNTITEQEVADHLTANTRCVIAVHLYGQTADLEPIGALTRRRGVKLVEDACQAHGALYRGRRVGSIGDAGCFSFYPSKNLGGWGDGGAVVTDNAALADHLRLVRAHGERPRYHHRLPGTTARLDALQATILRVKLRHLDQWNARRRSIAELLSALLDGAPVDLPAPPRADQDHVFHQYVICSDSRDQLRGHLQRHGVASGVHYPVPIHLSEAYAGLGIGAGDLPIAERHANRCCSLPISPFHTDEEIARIAAAVQEFDPGAGAACGG